MKKDWKKCVNSNSSIPAAATIKRHREADPRNPGQQLGQRVQLQEREEDRTHPEPV